MTKGVGKIEENLQVVIQDYYHLPQLKMKLLANFL